MLKSQLRALHLFKSFKNKHYHYSTTKTSHHPLIDNDFLVISDEIRSSGKPVVALESTIITHGLPYPTNLETAIRIENEIRAQDCVPATIAFLNGKLRVGLNGKELEQLADGHKNAVKISRRDLAYVLANPNDSSLIGGTTVSGTMIVAHAANIPIFCTGGIGGVHRDYANSMDVSADLQELARTPIAVVSSGVKSILNIQKTLEYLETNGVCVYTLARNGSKQFPAFFTQDSGFEAPYNCLDEKQAARIIHTNLNMGLNMGMLIGVPIPPEYAAENSLIESAIQAALQDAHKLNITGKKITPFLLARINELTNGASLASNIALILNNAKASAKMAVELKSLQESANTTTTTTTHTTSKTRCSKQVVFIGGINLDSTYKLTDEKTLHLKGVTQPVVASSCLGGVARNMAEGLIRLGADRSILFSSVGRDISGQYVTEESKLIGFDTSKWLHLNEDDFSTGTYNAIFDTKGELLFGCGDMRAHDMILPAYIQKHTNLINDSAMCVIDADIPTETIIYITNFCESKNIPIWYNPTDLRKSTKVVEAGVFSKLTFMSPNTKELFAMFKSTFPMDTDLSESEKSAYKILGSKYADIFTNLENNDLTTILKYMIKYVPVIVLSRGPKPVMLACAYDLDLDAVGQLPTRENLLEIKASSQSERRPVVFHFPVLKLQAGEVYMNESGAGDSLSAGFMYGVLNGYSLGNTVYNGILSAKLALMTSKNINVDIGGISVRQLSDVTDENRSKIRKEYI